MKPANPIKILLLSILVSGIGLPFALYAGPTTTVTPTTTTTAAPTTTTMPPLFDLDIIGFRASNRIRLSSKKVPEVSIKLTVKNNSTVAGSATATIVGHQGVNLLTTFVEVVTDAVGGGASSYIFTYVPDNSVVPGTIVWTASFDEEDPDTDEATTTTTVAP